MSTSRVEAFSDGVFAVAITLLVLDLRPPSPSGGSLIAALADEWPEFAAFVISFAFIGVIWVNHHAIFHRLKRVDRPLLFINLGLLITIVLIPFVTALFALYLAGGGVQASVAGALFNSDLLLMSFGFQAVVTWIAHHPALQVRAAARVSLAKRIRFGAGVPAYAACIGLAFISAPLVLIIDAAVAAFYIVDQVGTSHAAEDDG